ncbi:MAG: hypothetical protein FJ095_16670 [Deltaproteobacteria bacterium]|nr:hypothetical protein [Deltaproteobacteria bacterium]
MNQEPGHRRAWLTLGGYVAGADGLSPEEADALGRAGASEDLSAEDGIALILAAGESDFPTASAEEVVGVDVAFKVQCLVEVAHAVASDGMSANEEARFREVVARLLGTNKVDALLRLVRADSEARWARTELLA